MAQAWVVAAFAGPVLVLLVAVVVLRRTVQRAAERLERERARLRRDTLAQLAENHREHARALLKCAGELFVAGHVATAAMLEMHATDYELRAEDNANAALNPASWPGFPTRPWQQLV